jgi:plasmid stabilization system protein ParE
MSYRIELHPEAIAELNDSYQWYEERSPGLGERFISSLNKRLEELRSTPERYAKKKGNFREVGIEVFPYVIIYEIVKKESVVFVSYVFHAKRNPRLKYKR